MLNPTLRSPLAQLFATVIARDEMARAIDFAQLQATVSKRAAEHLRNEALAHAVSCIEVCEASGIEYDDKTLSHNIEGNFPDLDLDACDEIAWSALTK